MGEVDVPVIDFNKKNPKDADKWSPVKSIVVLFLQLQNEKMCVGAHDLKVIVH